MLTVCCIFIQILCASVYFVYFFKFIYLAALDLNCSTGDLFVPACGIFSCGRWDLVPWLGFKSGPLALGTQSLSHWTTREVLLCPCLNWFVGLGGELYAQIYLFFKDLLGVLMFTWYFMSNISRKCSTGNFFMFLWQWCHLCGRSSFVIDEADSDSKLLPMYLGCFQCSPLVSVWHTSRKELLTRLIWSDLCVAPKASVLKLHFSLSLKFWSQ